MSHPPSASRLFRWGRTRQLPDGPDAADMGTAFGLDMALPYPGIDEDPAPAAGAASAAAKAPDGGWLTRLLRRP